MTDVQVLSGSELAKIRRMVVKALSRTSALVLIGVIVTVAATGYVLHRPPVYWSQVRVLFVAPASGEYPNTLAITPSSLISTAGIVRQIVTNTDAPSRLSGADVTLAAQGITHGSSITLPNSGGQWANNYTQAELDVEATGPTAGEVQSTMQQLIGKVNAALDQIQRDAQVSDVNLISTVLSPPAIPIYRAYGSRVRALAATMVLGLGLTAALAMSLNRRRAARQSASNRGTPGSANGRRLVGAGSTRR